MNNKNVCYSYFIIAAIILCKSA